MDGNLNVFRWKRVEDRSDPYCVEKRVDSTGSHLNIEGAERVVDVSRFKSFERDLSSERGRREVRGREQIGALEDSQPGAIQIDIDTNPRFQQRG